MDAPSGGAPEQAPRWDLVDTEGCGGGIRFLAPVLIVRGYVGIYRRKEYVGGALGSKSPGSRSVGKSRSRRFNSVWTPFDIPFLRNTLNRQKTAILGWASG